PDQLHLAVPNAAELERRLADKRLVAPFEFLVANFRGRQKELTILRNYVGVMPTASVMTNATRQIQEWLNLTARGPLVVWGPGGVGKSTLIAKFILEHGRLVGELSLPFAYLDFDQPAL